MVEGFVQLTNTFSNRVLQKTTRPLEQRPYRERRDPSITYIVGS